MRKLVGKSDTLFKSFKISGLIFFRKYKVIFRKSKVLVCVFSTRLKPSVFFNNKRVKFKKSGDFQRVYRPLNFFFKWVRQIFLNYYLFYYEKKEYLLKKIKIFTKIEFFKKFKKLYYFFLIED